MWRAIGASVRGTSHFRSDTPCQDAHAYSLIDEHVLLVAVADGLGSADRSDEGSQVAVASALARLKTALTAALPADGDAWESLLHDVFAHTREALVHYAAERETRLHNFATTLIVAVLTETGLAVGQIGDGAVVAQLSETALETISLPQSGEYVNEVRPLTADNALEHVHHTVRTGRVEALALFTDGLQNLCLESATRAPYEPFFKPFFDGLPLVNNETAESERLALFLASDRVNTRTDDDKTLVLITLAQPDE